MQAATNMQIMKGVLTEGNSLGRKQNENDNPNPIVSFVLRAIGVLFSIPTCIWLGYFINKDWYMNSYLRVCEKFLRRFTVYPIGGLLAVFLLFPVVIFHSMLGTGRNYPEDKEAWYRFFTVAPWHWKGDDKSRAFTFLGYFDFFLFFGVISVFSFNMDFALQSTHYMFFWAVLAEGVWRMAALWWELAINLDKLSKAEVDNNVEYITEAHFDIAKINNVDLKRKYVVAERIHLWVNCILNFIACGVVFAVVSVNMTHVILDWGMPVDFGHLAWWGPYTFMIASMASVALCTFKIIENFYLLHQSNKLSPNEKKVDHRKEIVRHFNNLALNVVVLLVMLSSKFEALPAIFLPFAYPICAGALISGIFNWAVGQWVSGAMKLSATADFGIKFSFAVALAIIGICLFLFPPSALSSLIAIFMLSTATFIGGTALVTGTSNLVFDDKSNSQNVANDHGDQNAALHSGDAALISPQQQQKADTVADVTVAAESTASIITGSDVNKAGVNPPPLLSSYIAKIGSLEQPQQSGAATSAAVLSASMAAVTNVSVGASSKDEISAPTQVLVQ